MKKIILIAALLFASLFYAGSVLAANTWYTVTIGPINSVQVPQRAAAMNMALNTEFGIGNGALYYELVDSTGKAVISVNQGSPLVKGVAARTYNFEYFASAGPYTARVRYDNQGASTSIPSADCTNNTATTYYAALCYNGWCGNNAYCPNPPTPYNQNLISFGSSPSLYFNLGQISQ